MTLVYLSLQLWFAAPASWTDGTLATHTAKLCNKAWRNSLESWQLLPNTVYWQRGTVVSSRLLPTLQMASKSEGQKSCHISLLEWFSLLLVLSKLMWNLTTDLAELLDCHSLTAAKCPSPTDSPIASGAEPLTSPRRLSVTAITHRTSWRVARNSMTKPCPTVTLFSCKRQQSTTTAKCKKWA